MTDADPDIAVDTLDKAMITCPYKAGVGACVAGCWREPSCQTDEPTRGWTWRNSDGRFAKAPTRDQIREIATARQAAHRQAQEDLAREFL